MPTPNEKLAQSLDAMTSVQRDGVVRASQLSRTHRERLLAAGFLQEAVRGWLLVTNPAAPDRASTGWYASFWTFVAQYLGQRFGDGYCLGPKASLQQHVENGVIPAQVIVITRSGSNQTISLPFETSLLIYKDTKKFPTSRVQKDGLWIVDLPQALCRIQPNFFRTTSTDVGLALRLVREPSVLLRHLLEGGNSTVAGRLAGAYAALGSEEFASRIVETMKSAGYTVRPVNPFTEAPAGGSGRIASPAAARVRSLWHAMRPDVERLFPSPPGLPLEAQAYLDDVEDRYANDAYNSLSIEGYRVTPALIERVRSGQWDPQRIAADRQEHDALAARGYYQAFELVKGSLRKILQGEKAGQIVADDHQRWYQEMFAPAVAAGVLGAAQLAGYRDTPVYLRSSRHVPPRWEIVPECMETFFELLREEEHPGVRAVLGHFLFVYIHPYPDGNGRIGRFLMNALLAGGGYRWTIVHQSNRSLYLNALESASTDSDIKPLVGFVAAEMAIKD